MNGNREMISFCNFVIKSFRINLTSMSLKQDMFPIPEITLCILNVGSNTPFMTFSFYQCHKCLLSEGPLDRPCLHCIMVLRLVQHLRGKKKIKCFKQMFAVCCGEDLPVSLDIKSNKF